MPFLSTCLFGAVSQTSLRYAMGIIMAKDRETVCMYYESIGVCKKGREACHKGYCQRCDKYYPRAKVRHINVKKKKLEAIKKKERY